MKTILLTIFLLCSARIYSCDCLSPTPEEALKRYPVVFIGKLVYTTVDTNFLVPTGHGLQSVKYWTFDVIRYIKGLERLSSRISIISTGSNCDFFFYSRPNGSEFIIYADRLNDYGFLHFLTTHQCTQTKLTSSITDDYELKIFNDMHSWKIPEPLNPKFISKNISSKSQTGELNWTWGLIGLMLFNIALTFYLILREK